MSMFTMVTDCFSSCCDSDSGSEYNRATPLLSRTSPLYSTMPRRVYGKKKTVPTAASAVFGRDSPERIRTPLSDVTSLLSNLNVRQEDDNDDGWISTNVSENDAPEIAQAGPVSPELAPIHTIVASDQVSAHSSLIGSIVSDESCDHSVTEIPLSPDDIVLQPLTSTYKMDRGKGLPITAWNNLIPQGAEVEKIAEASFAEVYRVSIEGQSSILKLMQLKVPSDLLSSTSNSAIEVDTVVSEVRLMNALTEYPGFVTFKEAHLVRGRPCNAIIKAYTSCMKWSPTNGTSSFPNPAFFPSNALFLVIELGDAGTVLDEIPLQNICQVWDVFLGTVVSLAFAETQLQFEHRDLHENNICLSLEDAGAAERLNSCQRYGFSAYKVTIIDYGLSRATLQNGDNVFNDLESDLGIFHGSQGHTQFDTYRRMRSHLFTGDRKMFKKSWHNEESKQLNGGHTWSDYTPYSNVLWIKYLLGYLKKDFEHNGGSAEELRQFESETTELKRRLDPRTLVLNGGFASANEICEFVAQKGWINAEQIAAMGETSSFLSDSEDSG